VFGFGLREAKGETSKQEREGSAKLRRRRAPEAWRERTKKQRKRQNTAKFERLKHK